MSEGLVFCHGYSLVFFIMWFGETDWQRELDGMGITGYNGTMRYDAAASRA